MRPHGALVGVLLALGAVGARAHHILGIPHYAYDANYPQIPFVEIIAQAGEWDLHMSYMPGLIGPGERVRFKLYVRNRRSDKPLRVPLTGQVRLLRFGRAPEPVGEPFPLEVGQGPEGNDYKFFLSFPAREAYDVLVRFPFPDAPAEEIPFPVQVGATDDTWVFFAVLGGLAALVLAVRWRKGASGTRRPPTRSREGGA